MLKTVTMTGADSSVIPDQLGDISALYPFVEWGILLSRNSQGRKRFPPASWLQALYNYAYNGENPDKTFSHLKLSGHLCGSYVKELLMGNREFLFRELATSFGMFDRIQINTHGVSHDYDTEKLVAIIRSYPRVEFIFQYDEVNKALLDDVIASGVKNISTLFDLSHGTGVSPSSWPLPIQGIKCGYAGGLSPQNIKSNIIEVERIVGEAETWVDMETRIRSNNDAEFDLDKVMTVLEIATPFIR